MNLIKKLMCTIKNDRKVLCLFVIELLFLSYVLMTLFLPVLSVEVDGNEMIEDSIASGVYGKDGISLKSGAYDEYVYYQYYNKSDIDDVKGLEPGKVSVKYKKSRASIQMTPILLDRVDKVAHDVMWVSLGTKVDNFKVIYEPFENTDLKLDKVIIKEAPIYRVTRLCICIFLCLLINVAFRNLRKWDEFEQIQKIKLCGLLGLFLISNALVSGNFVYDGHDISFHLNRLSSVVYELSYGHVPVRMHSDVMGGYGYPTGLFYCDIFLYIPALLYYIKIPLGICYNIYVMVVNALTIYASYVCFKEITKDEIITLIGSMIYVLAPYRMIDTYTRAAVGEYTSMAFFPLIVLGVYRIYKHEKASLLQSMPLIFGVTGVVLSHVISSEMVAVFLLLFGLISWRKTFNLRRIKTLTISVLLVLLLCAWYLVPFVDSMRMNLEVFGRTPSIQRLGLYPMQWINIFIPSMFGTYEDTTRSSMGLSLGLPLFLSTVYMFLMAMRYEKNNKLSHEGIYRISGVLGVIAVAFTSRYFPWDIISSRSKLFAKYLCMIQFPWRYLAVASILGTIACVGVLVVSKKSRYKVWIYSVIVVITLISTLYYISDFSDKSGANIILSYDDIDTYSIVAQEYLPKGTNYDKIREGNIDNPNEIRLEVMHKGGSRYVYSCENDSDVTQSVLFPILNYDNYKALDVNSNIEFRIKNGDNNLISIDIPAGYNGTIEIKYVEPIYWRVAEVVSLCTLITIVIYCIWRKIDDKKRQMLTC